MNRRELLASTALCSIPALLAACSQPITMTQVQTDANLIAAGVSAVAPAILADPKLAPADAATIRSAVAVIQQANSVIQGTTVTPSGSVQQIVAAIRLLAPVALVALDASSPQAIAINAAVALLPVLLQAAGMPPAAMASAHPSMSAAEARMVLKGAAR
jgi:hypothetical protein